MPGSAAGEEELRGAAMDTETPKDEGGGNSAMTGGKVENRGLGL